jgi:large subunit ribosomal protein L19
MQRLDLIEKAWNRKRTPEFRIGDTVDVHVRIREGEKERTQIFSGTVIKRHGRGLGETFTVRRIVQGEGVERIFPIHSPNVVDVVVKRRGEVRRAKLYYLRERIGRATKIRERLGDQGAEEAADGAAAPAPAPPEPGPVPPAPKP